VTEQIQRIEESMTESKTLVAEPQLLGIIPTWWFWSDQANWWLVRGPAAILVGVVAFVAAVSGLPPLLAGIVAVVTFVTAIGLLERYIRRHAQLD
jgi:hypothetical protein